MGMIHPRKDEAVQMLTGGASVSAVARHIGATRVTVGRWRKELRNPPPRREADAPVSCSILDEPRHVYLRDRAAVLAEQLTIARGRDDPRAVIELIRLESKLHDDVANARAALPPPPDARTDDELVSATGDAILRWPEARIAEIVRRLVARHGGR